MMNFNNGFVHSAEIHYFNVPFSLWNSVLDQAGKVGINTISFYVPWVRHEISDGEFDFVGGTCPENNLVRFIELCAQSRFNCIVKAGPCTVAELNYMGLPEWLVKKHSQVIAGNYRGGNGFFDIPDYLNKTFLRYVKRWYKEVVNILAEVHREQGIRYGLQLCNEVGLYDWLQGKPNLSDSVLSQARRWAAQSVPDAVDLPLEFTRSQSIEKMDVARRKGSWTYRQSLWSHRLLSRTVAAYVGTLQRYARPRRPNTPLLINMGGWYRGRCYDFPLLLSLYRHVDKDDISIACNLIPEKISDENYHHIEFGIKVWACYFSGQRFRFISEAQAGTRDYSVAISPDQLGMLYKRLLVEGVDGINYYMFMATKQFYSQTPISQQGCPDPNYLDLVGRIGQLANLLGTRLEGQPEIAILIDPLYYETVFSRSEFTNRRFSSSDEKTIQFDIKRERDRQLLDGLANALSKLNHSYDVHLLRDSTFQDLRNYKQVWIFSLSFMSKRCQERVADLIAHGLSTVFFPTIPRFDELLTDCTLLSDYLGIKSVRVSASKRSFATFSKSGTTVNVQSPMTYFDADPCDVICTTTEGCCGFTKKIEGANVVVIGAFPILDCPEAFDLLEKIIASAGVIKGCSILAKDCDVRLCVKEVPNGRVVFMANISMREQSFRLSLVKNHTPPRRVPERVLFHLPSDGSRILLLDFKVTERMTIEYATCEILTIDVTHRRVSLTAFSDSSSPHEICVHEKSAIVQRAIFNGNEVHVRKEGKRLFFILRFKGKGKLDIMVTGKRSLSDRGAQKATPAAAG